MKFLKDFLGQGLGFILDNFGPESLGKKGTIAGMIPESRRADQELPQAIVKIFPEMTRLYLNT